ncbi:MAG: hypothetical protein MMC23_009160 [Stictis urceolatum]|nr:hypothetical protein [Stictis urceolata]
MSAPIGKEPASAAALPMSPSQAHLDLPKYSMDQNLSLSQCPTPQEEHELTATSPFSPFYSHPTTRTSFEQQTASQSNLKVYETDIESGDKRFSMEPTPVNSHTSPNKDCKVWPTKSTLVREKKVWKKQRGCRPWNTMTRKQKLWTKIIVLLLVIGLVVGVAVGISKAVGGTVYSDSNHSKPIDD